MTKDQVVLITGANSGIGKMTALELAKQGMTVVMLCRNPIKGEAALAEVRELSGNQSVELMICDLGSLEDIRRFAEEFKARYSKLHILINNAGVILPKRQETLDGFERQFGVNHLGHFLLANLLLKTMIYSAPARIINVSSGIHKVGKIRFDDLNATKSYSTWKAYAQAKLANVLFTYELARRLGGTGVTANCLHPGAVATNMGIDRETGFGSLITKLLKPFFQTPAQGAETSIYLATSDQVAGVSGKYFYRKKAVSSSKSSYDRKLAQKLWKVSEEMVGL